MQAAAESIQRSCWPPIPNYVDNHRHCNCSIAYLQDRSCVDRIITAGLPPPAKQAEVDIPTHKYTHTHTHAPPARVLRGFKPKKNKNKIGRRPTTFIGCSAAACKGSTCRKPMQLAYGAPLQNLQRYFISRKEASRDKFTYDN